MSTNSVTQPAPVTQQTAAGDWYTPLIYVAGRYYPALVHRTKPTREQAEANRRTVAQLRAEGIR